MNRPFSLITVYSALLIVMAMDLALGYAGPTFYNMVHDNSTVLNPVTKFKTKFVNSLYSHKISTRSQCLVCKFSVNLIHHALLTERGADEVNRIADTMCRSAQWETEAVCHKITRLFRDEVTKVLAYAVFTPDQICGLMSDNKCGHFNDPLAPWEVPLEIGPHMNLEELHKLGINERQYQFDSNNTQQAKRFKVVHISDTHVDLDYRQGAPITCNEPLCCQSTSTPHTGQVRRFEAAFEPSIGFERGLGASHELSTRGAGYWGSYGYCDVPPRMLEALLHKINVTLANDPDIEYIVWTGDIQPHDVWKQNQSSATATYDAVFKLIEKHLPKAKIFPTLGNHESVPVDSFAPSNMADIAQGSAPTWLYKELDKFWSRWLPANTQNTIYHDGNYAAKVRQGLKIISLNTNYCNNKNFWLYINSTDPGDQLKWLVHELQISEVLGEQVHIIGHIPPGLDDCMKVWSHNYNRIVQRYKRTISGQFYGHTHTNEFQVFYEKTQQPTMNTRTTNSSQSNLNLSDREQNLKWTAISVGFIGPSLTTFINLNPSFRVYTIDPSRHFIPIDFESYFMNLTQANGRPNLHDFPEWENFGSFSQQFGLDDITPSNIHKFIVYLSKSLGRDEPNDISLNLLLLKYHNHSSDDNNLTENNNEQSLESLFKFYRLFYGFSDMYGTEQFNSCDNKCKKQFLCRFMTSDSSEAGQVCEKYINSYL